MFCSTAMEKLKQLIALLALKLHPRVAEPKKIDLLNPPFLCNNSSPEPLRAGARAVTDAL